MEFERKLMAGLAQFVIRFRRWIPIGAGVLLVLSIIAMGNLRLETEMKDLLPESNPMVASYEEIIDAFNGGESIFILVEGPNKSAMIDAAKLFVSELRAKPNTNELIEAINLEVDRDFIADWGLMLQDAEDLERSGAIFSDVNLLPLLRSLNDTFENTYNTTTAEEELSNRRQESDAVAMYQQMETLFTTLRRYLEDPDQETLEEQGRELADLFYFGEPYSFVWDNSMLVFTIIPGMSVVDFEPIVALTESIRQAAATVERSIPGVTVGYTGNVPIQADEQEALSLDMLVPAVVALLFILVLFIFSFQQLRAVAMTLAILIVAIIYNYGFAAVTIREITMLTSFMSTLLIGLGIDYGIQIITNFNAFRSHGESPEDAIRQTFRKAGMGTMLAAFTTAVAFFVMALTGSKAFAQFGYMASAGIVLCFLSMILILPSLLLLWGRSDLERTRIPKIDYRFLGRFARFLGTHRTATLVTGALLTLGLIWAATGLQVEYDFMSLEPQDMPSIISWQRMAEKMDITPSQSMVLAESIEEAHRLTDDLEKEPLVAEVVSVAQFLPTETQARERLDKITDLRRNAGGYTHISYQGQTLEDFLYEIQRVEWNLIEIGDLSVAGLGEDNKIVRTRNRIIREILGADVGKPGAEVFQRLIDLIKSDPGTYGARLTALDATFAPAAADIVHRMINVQRSITPRDLPEEYQAAFFDDSLERNLITIFPRDGIFEHIDEMRQFSADMTRVDPRITGTVQFGLEWTDEAFASSTRAGVYILIVVVLALLFEFRSLRWAAAAAFPLVIGMIWMLGLYHLIGLKINPVNLVMVPLIIGMAVDFGIHLVHRYRLEHDLMVTYTYTGKAVFLSAMTTMIGFGSLAMIGKFASIALIGAILFLGIASALLVSFTVLPGLLREKREVQQ